MSIAIDGSWALIFGGCCSNVFALEAILKHEADSGLLITVVQFFTVALFAFPSQLEKYTRVVADRPKSKYSNGSALSNHEEPLSPGFTYTTSSWRWKKPAIPIMRLISTSIMFFSVNMLNNWAFAFDISVPMHIILRSFGSVTTLAIGWLYGKRYSRVQITSVLVLTVGVIASAWADATAKGNPTSISLLTPSAPASRFLPGLMILFAGQIMSAFLGVYSEATYANYGRHWTTTLFYTHAFSLCYSALFYPVLHSQAIRILSGPAAALPGPIADALAPFLAPVTRLPAISKAAAALPDAAVLARYHPPQALLLLILNALTQVACIAGVNRLSAQTTAVAVTVVLNVRKLASFLLSCVVFGNRITPALAAGATVVFGSGAIYGWDSSRKRTPARKRAETGPSGAAVGKAE